MVLRGTAVFVALLLFAGEGVCTTLCSPEPSGAETSHSAALPSCHDPAPEPEAPPSEHECEGPCAASLVAASPELSSPAPQAALLFRIAATARPTARTRVPVSSAPERLPPPPARFLLHASFLI